MSQLIYFIVHTYDMSGTLYGVSVGPGDPKMLTLKAKEIIESSDIVCFPVVKKGGKSTALNIIKDVVDLSRCELKEIFFSMSTDIAEIKRSEMDAAEEIASMLDEEKNVSLITLGDAGVYSTYMYVNDILLKKGYHTEVIAGISAFIYGAARARLPLMLEDETLCIVPMARNNIQRLDDAIRDNDNVVLMKAFGSIGTIGELLDKHNIPFKNATVMSNIGMDDEYVGPLDTERDYGYFTTVLIKRSI